MPTKRKHPPPLGCNKVWSGCTTHGVHSAAQTHVGSWLLTAVQEGDTTVRQRQKAPVVKPQARVACEDARLCDTQATGGRPVALWARAAACSSHRHAPGPAAAHQPANFASLQLTVRRARHPPVPRTTQSRGGAVPTCHTLTRQQRPVSTRESRPGESLSAFSEPMSSCPAQAAGGVG